MSRHDVIIVGGGPAGLGACESLVKRGGLSVLLLERSARLGGVPGKYRSHNGAIATFVDWTRGRVLVGEEFVESISSRLRGHDFEHRLETSVLSIDPARHELECVSPSGVQRLAYRALILACGARERTPIERRAVFGDRPARVYNTMQVLDFLEAQGRLPISKPVIVGSDLVALSVAAKLRKSGADEPELVDRENRSSFFERLYFRRWSALRRRRNHGSFQIQGFDAPGSVAGAGDAIKANGVVLAGDLIPNSELPLEAGMNVSQPERIPQVDGRYSLGEDVYVCGNLLGGFHGAQWCHGSGRRVGALVGRALEAEMDSKD